MNDIQVNYIRRLAVTLTTDDRFHNFVSMGVACTVYLVNMNGVGCTVDAVSDSGAISLYLMVESSRPAAVYECVICIVLANPNE